jgi:uncharacterized membrane protein
VGKQRLEAFSDGVLAVAITLLALDLKAPAEADLSRGLWHGIATHWPTYAAYVVSFLIIGIMWISHNSVLHYIERVDRPLLFLNLMLLLFIVVIPPMTALVGDQLMLHGQHAHTALVLYSGLGVAHASAWLALWWWAATHPALLAPDVDPARARGAVLRFGLGLPIYAAAVGLAFVNAYVALAFQFVVAISYMFEQLHVQRTSAGSGLSGEVRAEKR